jgi:hypothetical protein
VTPRTTARALTALALAAAAACGGGGTPKADDSPAPTSTTASPTLSPTPSPTPTSLRSPLTGQAVAELRPVTVIKVDNIAPALPQDGLDRADIVYEELVEGGQTRFMAVYSSQDAGHVGPVRSVRESDLEVLAAYGKVVFAFSGGNDGVKRTVARAPVINASYDFATSAYRKEPGRKAPYNLFTSTETLRRLKPGGAVAKDIGLVFGPATTPGPPVQTLSLRWSPFRTTAFTWDAASRTWLRSQNGRPTTLMNGRRIQTPNVVVQYVTIKQSRYVDVAGARTPYTVTTGSGKVDIFRDGRRIPGTWTRSGPNAPTIYRDANGRPLPLTPGSVWVLLAPSNTRAAIS